MNERHVTSNDKSEDVFKNASNMSYNIPSFNNELIYELEYEMKIKNNHATLDAYIPNA